ncbi:MAG: ABC transporter permease [Planctomycetes bacterium]|nr:ABC transporter permease [Planctomycetota bacterium]
MLAEVGRSILHNAEIAGRCLSLLGRALLALRHIGRGRSQIVRQLDMAGFGSILVLCLIAGLTGMIMAVQTGSELEKFGVLKNLGAIIGATFCCEMGPIWAAVIVLARVGASMAAELGTMTVNEEVDALKVMSIDPVRYLVMPRILALMISMPLLTTMADFVGLLGGALVTKAQFGQPLRTFMESAQGLLDGMDFYSGLFKSLVFAVIIGTISCDQGLATKNGAEGVGRATTATVVLSIVFVLLSDHIMNYILLKVITPLMGLT